MPAVRATTSTLEAMKTGRITFPGNPWPEGHALKQFRWSAERRGDDIWFHFHLETENYYAERDIEDEDDDYPSDWEAPGVWGNYHSCIISSDHWHQGGFRGCSLGQFAPELVDGLKLHVDPPPYDLEEDYEARAFHIYLLGHDSVADHKIVFSRAEGADLFDITWEGKIALTYAGNYEAKHRFHAEIKGVTFPKVPDGA